MIDNSEILLQVAFHCLFIYFLWSAMYMSCAKFSYTVDKLLDFSGIERLCWSVFLQIIKSEIGLKRINLGSSKGPNFKDILWHLSENCYFNDINGYGDFFFITNSYVFWENINQLLKIEWEPKKIINSFFHSWNDTLLSKSNNTYRP